MKTFAERFYGALENQLNEISVNTESLTDQYKASIILCKKAMAKLKNYISSYSFESTDEEIHFFKVVKPQFYSKYIYFISVYNFIMKKPTGSDEIVKDYINYELADLKRFLTTTIPSTSITVPAQPKWMRSIILVVALMYMWS